MQAQLVGRLADAEQGNPFGRCKAIAGKGLDGELLSVMLAYHRQASDAALHGVVLCIKGEIIHHRVAFVTSNLTPLNPCTFFIFFPYRKL